MKLSFTYFNNIFEWNVEHPGYIVIENPEVFMRFIREINDLFIGNESEVVISENDKEINLQKSAIQIRDLFDIDLNQRKLLSAIQAELGSVANEDLYIETQSILSTVYEYLMLLLQISELPVMIEEKIDSLSIIKAANVRFENADDPLERLVDYIRAMQQYAKIQLVIFVNLRSFMTDKQYQEICKEMKNRKLYVLFIETIQRKRISNERVFIIDNDLCELIIS